jgi:coenzyme Q-binding protein COQ10
VRRQEGPGVEIDEIAIGFGPFHEKFVSRVTSSADDPAGPRITTVGIEGPFKHLVSGWLFKPHEQGCEIEFSLEFEFRSLILQHTVRMLFAEAVKRMVSAFEARAVQLYGRKA